MLSIQLIFTFQVYLRNLTIYVIVSDVSLFFVLLQNVILYSPVWQMNCSNKVLFISNIVFIVEPGSHTPQLYK